MHSDLQATLAFHLTGRRAGDALGTVEETGLRPALLAGYRDLSRLRYDFPLVLLREAPDGAIAEPLSFLVDRMLEAVPAGIERQRLQARALKVEAGVRAMVAAGARGPLSELLDEAARRLGPGPALALERDGEVLDCDAGLPAKLLAHAWRRAQEEKARAFRKRAGRLILRLEDILGADAARSEAARSPECLRASIGATYAEAFDFEAMSRILGRAAGPATMTESRRRRIEATLAALKQQRFFAAEGGPAPLEFEFRDCASALAAFRERVPAMERLARAIAVARLEIDGEYSEPRHDALFERLAAAGLDLRDMAMFPDYLVCVNERDLRETEHGELMEILASGLPMRILVQTDDILAPPILDTGHQAFGARGRRFANMAIGLRDVYVLQAPGSHLPRLSDRIARAMSHPGPALFSVFTGATGHAGGLPPYLVAAAAMESRAFPAFTYDPGAGEGWAARLSVEFNPQAERDWPLHALVYEDAVRQSVAEAVPFTLLDFVSLDRRYAGHFARVPRPDGIGSLAPAAECLDREAKGVPDTLPSLTMVDAEDRLHKVVVDGRPIGEARRCRDLWRSLRELGGIGVSRAVPVERVPEETKVAPEKASTPEPSPEPVNERGPDEPYIETPRCSSCDECIQLNNRMFAYDGNKQARIVDVNAGTYRQLVEAAENCQVAIIHPGKPKNPDEPGLDELLKRAGPFL